jgi:hypothetical protein
LPSFLFCLSRGAGGIKVDLKQAEDIIMRHLIKLALLTGAALAVSGCNRGAPVANNAANEVVDNGTLEAPGNDASAMESVTNAPLPPPPAESNAANDAAPETAPPPPSTPNVESNVSGM